MAARACAVPPVPSALGRPPALLLTFHVALTFGEPAVLGCGLRSHLCLWSIRLKFEALGRSTTRGWGGGLPPHPSRGACKLAPPGNTTSDPLPSPGGSPELSPVRYCFPSELVRRRGEAVTLNFLFPNSFCLVTDGTPPMTLAHTSYRQRSCKLVDFYHSVSV